MCNDSCMAENLSTLLKRIREDAKDTPAAAAGKVGVSRQAYMKWETGDTENMKIRNLVTFCDKYNIALEPLVRGEIIALGEAHPTSGTKYGYAGATQLIAAEISNGRSVVALTTKAQPPDPDESLLIEAYRVASPDVRRIMMANARETLTVFEKRSEPKN